MYVGIPGTSLVSAGVQTASCHHLCRGGYLSDYYAELTDHQNVTMPLIYGDPDCWVPISEVSYVATLLLFVTSLVSTNLVESGKSFLHRRQIHRISMVFPSEMPHVEDRESIINHTVKQYTSSSSNRIVQQDSTDRSELQQNSSDRSELQQTSSDRSELQQNSSDRSELQQNGSARSELQQNGSDCSELQQNGSDRSELQQNSSDRSELEQNSSDRSELEQNGSDQSTVHCNSSNPCTVQKIKLDRSIVQKNFSNSSTVKQNRSNCTTQPYGTELDIISVKAHKVVPTLDQSGHMEKTSSIIHVKSCKESSVLMGGLPVQATKRDSLTLKQSQNPRENSLEPRQSQNSLMRNNEDTTLPSILEGRQTHEEHMVPRGAEGISSLPITVRVKKLKVLSDPDSMFLFSAIIVMTIVFVISFDYDTNQRSQFVIMAKNAIQTSLWMAPWLFILNNRSTHTRFERMFQGASTSFSSGTNTIP